MTFFKTFFASCLGAIVALVVVVFLGIIVLTAMVGSVASGSSDGVSTISENSVLHLKLNMAIKELENDDPLSELLPGLGDLSTGLIQLKSAIRFAKTDDNIK